MRNSHSCEWKTVNDNKDGLLEICIICKRKLVTKKDPKTGRIDNRKYLKEHVRETAQPFGRTSKIFNRYYGEEAGYISRFK